MKRVVVSGTALLLCGLTNIVFAQDLKLLFGSPRDAEQQIRILDALYGQDQQVCRGYDAVAQLCDGREHCAVEADDRLCGNPYGNVQKQLFIAYDCGDGRRTISVDEGQTARVYCLQGGAEGLFGQARRPVTSQRDSLQIQSAEYGAGARLCDATQAFSSACDGQRQCQLKVDNKLCGDPARGVGKVATVRYWCNGDLRETKVKERKTAQLTCY